MFELLKKLRKRRAAWKYREALWMSRVAIGFLLVGICFGICRICYLAAAVETDARIVEFIQKEGDQGRPTFRRVYEFEDQDNNLVKVTSAFEGESKTKEIGDSIKLLYLPKFPRWVVENDFMSEWMATIVCVTLGGGFYLYFRYRMGTIPLAGRSPILK